MNNNYAIRRLSLVLGLIFIAAGVAVAQTSEFTHQGKFPEMGGTASGNYQMEFKLFDAATGGTQIGTTISIANVSVTKSVFSVNLDFGAEAFPGADRFLEIASRKTSAEPFTILGPRSKITSAPYSIKSKSAETATTATAALTADLANIANSATRANTATNALQLGGLGAIRFVRFDDNDNVGIGTTSTGSKLAVAGTIESMFGGIKFPDATTQATAGITSVNTNATLTGNGTAASPLTVASPLMVRDLDHPARLPFSASASDTLDTLITVPAGKVVIIEFVAAIMSTIGATLTTGEVSLVIQERNHRFFLAPSFSRTIPDPQGPQTLTHYTHSVRIILQQFEKLRLVCGGVNVIHCQGTVSGYLVDQP